MDEKFKKAFVAAFNAGPESLAEFIYEHFALDPHDHTSDQIIVDPTDGETLEDMRNALLANDEEEEEGGESTT